MNLLLKILVAGALVVLIIAGVVYIVGSVATTPPPALPPQPVAPEPSGKPSEIDVNKPLQPTYRPINQPEYIRMLRREGKTYTSVVTAKLEGKASKGDWGIKGIAYFTYTYTVQSTGRILSNNGMDILEERSFDVVRDDLFVSEYALRLDIPEELFEWVEVLSKIVPKLKVVKEVGRLLNQKQVALSPDFVDALRNAGWLPGGLDVEQIKMFTQKDHTQLLDKKTIRIMFTDGKGITKIEPVGCTITDKERDAIVRANFIMDYYIFPDRKVEPGDKWMVDGAVFGGFLDPRLSGKIKGEVEIARGQDFERADGCIVKRLEIRSGSITVIEEGARRLTTGKISGLHGKAILPEDVGVVTEAWLEGYAEYRAVSTDHLLFEANHAVEPRFKVQYQCKVE